MVASLSERLVTHARDARLFPQPGLALLAVSGGPDSAALLELMVRVASKLGVRLVVGHVDHGIHAASATVAGQVAALAARANLPFIERTLALGPQASETVARSARYAALRAMQRETGARYLVTAHHADDQIETVLYRVLRGTGIAGLAGIPARGPEGLVRPLLPFSRAELETWIAEVPSRTPDPEPRIPIFDDPANVDERHDRSWLRTRVFPLLRARFGAALPRRLQDLARHAARERRAWRAVLVTLSELEFHATRDAVEVAQAPLARYDKTLSEALLRALARELGHVLGPRRAARLVAFAHTGTSGQRCELGGGVDAELSFGRLRLARRTARAITPAMEQLDGSGAGSLRWDGWELCWRPDAAGAATRESFTTWITPGPGVVRAPGTGDRLVPLGGVGRRKVRRILMDAGVPSRDRDAYPVIVRGDAILWIPGICRAAADVPRPGEPAVRIDARAIVDP